jgi:hypothetical protein
MPSVASFITDVKKLVETQTVDLFYMNLIGFFTLLFVNI